MSGLLLPRGNVLLAPGYAPYYNGRLTSVSPRVLGLRSGSLMRSAPSPMAQKEDWGGIRVPSINELVNLVRGFGKKPIPGTLLIVLASYVHSGSRQF